MNLPHFLLMTLVVFTATSFAQTTTTYDSTTGAVGSYNSVTGYFTAGGSFVSPGSMGSNCYYGGCPAWQFSGYGLSYVLPDGSTASFNNFTGTADFVVETDVKVQGTASGTDSKGRAVSVSIAWQWGAFCRGGRSGGCSKHFISGSMTVTTQ